LVSRPLEIRPVNGQFRASGTFGLFQCGSIEMVMIERAGKPLAIKSLGYAHPLEPCRIDEAVPASSNLGRVSIRLRTSSGALLGTIAEAQVSSWS
jgi:hypothetical protein